ncbi:class I SAM-dependent RNA methyltransferase [Desulfovibrio sp. OttesenSCG-928-G15]|nr:class I SAM-dependent RNA methyltransferase [Desulfovibrio sp. OttesenSCG-928-G15]
MPLESGTELHDLTITDLTVQGQSIARHDGRVLFLDQGLPGEVVDARVIDIRKKTVFCEVTHITQYSPNRVSPWCPHFGDCGACMWQHCTLKAQREWKHRHVTQTLARIGKVTDIVVHPVAASPLSRAYRNKMAFAFGASSDEEGCAIGLRLHRGHALVEVTQCGIIPEAANQVVGFVRNWLNADDGDSETASPAAGSGSLAGYLRFLVVRVPDYAPEGKRAVHVECITGTNHRALFGKTQDDAAAGGRKGGTTNRDKVMELANLLCSKHKLADGFVHSERKSTADVAQGERVIATFEKPFAKEAFDGCVLSCVPHDAFLQTNTSVATLLYRRVAEEAGLGGTEVLWDLYCGVGSIALYLAGQTKEAHGFEVNPNAVKAARKNAAALGMSNCHFHTGALGKTSLSGIAAPDCIVLDPPRAGLDEGVAEMLLSLPARKLLYVSCDAATLARDCTRLASRWTPTACYPFDMFPNTPHVETLTVFTPR